MMVCTASRHANVRSPTNRSLVDAEFEFALGEPSGHEDEENADSVLLNIGRVAGSVRGETDPVE